MDTCVKKKARIRAIRDAVSMLKKIDSNTAITYHFIRRLCDNGKISTILAGKKILINFDELLTFLGIEEV